MPSLRLLVWSLTLMAGFGLTAQDHSKFDFLQQYLNRDEYRIEGSIHHWKVHFSTEADFEFAKIYDIGYFDDAQFDSSAIFRKAVFNEVVYFRGAQFDSMAAFRGAEFQLLANFHRSKFNYWAEFDYARFGYIAYFPEARFMDQSSFTNVVFGSRVDFRYARFKKVHFSLTEFHGTTRFSYAVFMENTYFNGAIFSKDISFEYSRFRSDLSFANAQFDGNASFRNVELPEILSFESVKTATTIDLTAARLDSTLQAEGRFCRIDLRDAPIEKFKLRYDKFRVYQPTSINQTEYERLTNVYEGLLKNFKDHGYRTSYETLDKEYQAFKDMQNPDATVWKRILNQANFYWNNYGYNKERIWLYTLGFFLFFYLINVFWLQRLATQVFPIAAISDRMTTNVYLQSYALRKLHMFLWYRCTYAFYYTALIFFGLKVSTDQLNFDRPLSVFYIFLQYTLGLICLGYLANFIIASGVIG